MSMPRMLTPAAESAYDVGMTTTTEVEHNTSPRGAVAAIVRRPADRKVVGYVVRKPSTFEARRHTGEQGVDIRCIAPGFRSVEAAIAWIERVA